MRQHSILGLVRGRDARMHVDNAGETPAHRFKPTLILELDAPLRIHTNRGITAKRRYQFNDFDDHKAVHHWSEIKTSAKVLPSLEVYGLLTKIVW